MSVGYSKYLNAIYIIGDLFILNFSFAIVSFVLTDYNLKVDTAFLVQFLYINLFWLITVFLFKIYDIDRIMRYEQVMGNVLKTVVTHCLLLISFKYLLSDYIVPIKNFIIKYNLFVMLLIVWRSLMLLLIRFLRTRGLNYRRVIIVGNGELAGDMQKFFMSHPQIGYRFLGNFNDNGNERVGTISEAPSFALKNSVDEVYCSVSDLKETQITDLIKFCDQNMIRFKLIPDFRGLMTKRVKIDFYETVPVISLRSEPLESVFNRVVKRLFDMFFSLLVIICVFPWLFLITAVFVKLSSKGPLLFKQKRSGKNNVEFTCWKFRTMEVNDEADEVQATINDGRITWVGKILRQTNLDEIPQFFNVFIGQMSIVGPRPHMLKHTAQYSKMFDKFMVRHLIKPGITGWAQVNGFRGSTQEPEKMEKRVEFDVWYIENWSLLLDVKIVFLTVFNMLRGEENAV